MINHEIQQYVKDQIDQNQKDSLYSTSNASSHTHNGIDSPILAASAVAGVGSVTASGAGISASPTTGAVILQNTGVTSLIAGTGISVSGSTGAVTISGTSTITPQFGGNGTDGVLTISSGVTTIDLASAAVVVKNYTSISITGTGQLAFINANSNGTEVILKSQGTVTMTSSATPNIDDRGVGAAGGAGSVGVNTAGVNTSGSPGNDGFDYGLAGITIGRFGLGGNTTNSGSSTGRGGPGGGGASSVTIGIVGGNAGGSTGGSPGTIYNATLLQMMKNPIYTRITYAAVGSGGGGGTGGNSGFFSGASTNGGAGGSAGSPNGGSSGSTTSSGSSQGVATGGGGGGAGGGALYIECGGALNFTGTIAADGGNGGNSGNATITSGSPTNTASGGGGGGGSGGTVIILYNSLTANSGTISVTGGTGGTAGTATGGSLVNAVGATGGNGGNGFSLVAQNIVFV